MIMRKSTTMFVLAIMVFIPFILRAQHKDLIKEIVIPKQVLSGHELLEEITKTAEYKFSYSESVIVIPAKIELLKTKGSIQYFLDKIFEGQDVKYLIEDKTIFIKPVFERISQDSIFSKSGIVIKGKVIDKETYEAIPFANIAICNQSIGLSSNEFGEFVFKIPNTFKDDELCINVIGYSVYNQKINFFNEEKYNIIQLEPKIYDLNEVRINEKRKRKFNKPKEIVKLAIENIEKNYPQQAFIQQGYYREYLKHGNNSYQNMLEAAIVNKDKGFIYDFFPYNAEILQIRYNQDFRVVEDFQLTYKDEKTETGYFKYIPNHNIPSFGGNELSILFAHDAIRRQNELTYSFVNKFNEDFILNHSFTLDSIIFSDNIPIYCLSFSPNINCVGIRRDKIIKYPQMNVKYKEGEACEYRYNSNIHGKMMIRSNTWAIERFEYSSYTTKEPNIKIYEVIVDYKNLNGKMYLNYLSFSNYFKVFIHPQRTNKFEIAYKEQPLIVNEIFVEKNTIILKFNRKLRKLSCSKKDFEFSGFVVNNIGSKSDTIYMQKNPDDVTIIDENSIRMSLPNIQHLLTSFPEPDIKISDSEILEYGKATIRDDKIVMGNLSLTINKIKDVSGNKLNELYLIDMYQYREFFVNDIPKSFPKPKYCRTIFNELPLYDQNPKNVNDFWESFNYPTSMPLLGK
jgi:CarboxypepD_reg-like domain